eukprot:UN31323
MVFFVIQTLNGTIVGLLGLISVDLFPPHLERLSRIVTFSIIWTCVLTGGFLVVSKDLPGIFQWMTRVSYVARTVEGFISD